MIGRLTRDERLLGRREFLLEVLHALLQLLDLGDRLVGLAAQQPRNIMEHALLTPVDPVERAFTRDGLDAAHPGGNTALGRDLEHADIARALDMCATAQAPPRSRRSRRTRTSSPYFSPNNAIAPDSSASS